MSTPEERLDGLRRLSQAFMHHVPHNRALGIEMVELEDGSAKMSLPYSDNIIGNPETGVIHGGAITSLMDACCGAAVFMKLKEPMPIATLDLRIDYLRPSTPRAALYARVECYKLTRNVAFTRGTAYNSDPNDPVASMSATFMLQTQAARTKSESDGQ